MEPKTLKCFAGLCDSAVPVRVGNNLIAFLQTGQILLHSPSQAEFTRATRELTGVDSGAGLWFNYLFGLVWLCDLVAWRVRGGPLPRGSWRPVATACHGFLAVMIFNGTVVFGQGPVRGFGIGVFALLAAGWLRATLESPSDP